MVCPTVLRENASKCGLEDSQIAMAYRVFTLNLDPLAIPGIQV